MRIPAIAVAVVSVCLAASSGARAEDVNIKLFQYKPGNLEIKAGTTVKWTNGEDIEHSVTAGKPGKESGAFDSGFFTKGGSYEFTFAEPGTFTYFCKRHGSMKATVTVTP